MRRYRYVSAQDMDHSNPHITVRGRRRHLICILQVYSRESGHTE